MSCYVTIQVMVEISVKFAIITPGSLDPGMHFSLEVKWLNETEVERYIIDKFSMSMISYSCTVHISVHVC